MARRGLVVFFGIVLVALGVYIAVFFLAGRTRTVEGILRKYQFTELSPPSTLSPPGTLVTVIKENPLVIGVICSPTEALGSQLGQALLTSDSSSSREAGELTGTFGVTAGRQRQLTAGIDSKYVKKIGLTLTEVKLIEIPDSAVFQLVTQRKDSCRKAIEFRRKRGQTISMIKSVIEANVLYSVEFETGLGAATRAEIVRRIASGMGMKVNGSSEDAIEGDGLYWGVRDDEALGGISVDRPPPTGAGKRQRILPIDGPGLVIRDADESD
jgi:hypothetical protein